MLEQQPVSAEKISTKEELEQQLVVAKEVLNSMKERASEFYDSGLHELLVNAVQRFDKESAIRLYIESAGNDYKNVLLNLEKKKAFEKEQLLPLSNNIWFIEKQIREIVRKDLQVKEDEKIKEAENKFKEEKELLETRLYEALELIHKSIPAEAAEVGMTTEAALKTYAPRLEYKANQIEYYIGSLEEVTTPFQLQRLQNEISNYAILDR